jgi:hypothetical protein
MKTLLLELDDSIYTQVLCFLKLLPEKQCHIIEKKQNSENNAKPMAITAAFGLIKTPISATLEEIEQGIIAGAIDDSH